MVYDIIIVGMGPAGISAAIYAKRAEQKVLILEKANPGGIVNFTEIVGNYPGLYEIAGPDLAFKMFDQVNKMEIPYKMAEVINITKEENDYFKIVTKTEEFLTRRVILAMGRSAKRLGISHEEEYIGKGISNCAICDGPLFKDKDVVVVGGGNSALEESLYLSNVCNKVYLVHRRDEFRAEREIQESVKEKENIEIIYNASVKDIVGEDGRLSKVILTNDQELMVSGMFSYIGYVPKTDFIADLGITDEVGYVLVDSHCETEVKGIFAAGDIIKKDVYQIVTAVSEGAVAAIFASK